ncbi:DUF551 domain-containing protein [Enterobacter sp. 37]|uniref:DUF551 domain-containing protein n=1 Tax=Enterobacter sp. 37 TaxID=3085083 RepID=UPI002FC58A64
MSTITIGWLNKCRCGNKSHTVKTARGNETALWDDDAVKCNSCGRGGVIQVCEGQARVLWETDEEMAEGKPVSTITKEFTKEQLIERCRGEIELAQITLRNGGSDTPHAVEESLRLHEIALASLEAEAVYQVYGNSDDTWSDVDEEEMTRLSSDGEDTRTLYAAPPAPVTLLTDEQIDDVLDSRGNILYVIADKRERLRMFAREILRAAMLQGAEPVTTACKLPFEQWLSQQTGTIDVECGCVMTEVFFHWLRVAYEAGNSPVIPDGWVACSERMPENDDFVYTWPRPDFGVELHVAQYGKFDKREAGWYAQVYEQNYGIEYYPIKVTHWMPMPAAPQQEVKP